MPKEPIRFNKLGSNYEDYVKTVLHPMNKHDSKKFMQELFEKLESLRNEQNNIEFWHARDLKELFGYSKWENFIKIITKAKESCKNSGHIDRYHFLDVRKLISIGKNAERKIEDILLTRYACYLIAQNGDPRKLEIAFAQNYFANQTRKFEIILKRIEEYERLDAREKLKETENKLSGIVYQRGFTDKDFGIMRSKGDEALFGGYSTGNMKYKLGIPSNRPLADFLDTVIIKGKDFASAMTAFKVEEENLNGVNVITNEHIINNDTVRKALLERGIFPENLPAQIDIKKVERKIKSEEKELVKSKDKIPEIENATTVNEYKIHKINISKDLWKIVLLIMVTKPAGIITTTELIEEVPKYIIVPDKYKEISDSKKEPKYIQVIRNLKSNKKNKVNFIYQGYVNEIRGGYQITKKGLNFVKNEFKDYIEE